METYQKLAKCGFYIDITELLNNVGGENNDNGVDLHFDPGDYILGLF